MSTWSMLYFQDSASPEMEQLILFHDFTMMIITLIMTLVAINMFSICYYKLTNRFLLQEQTIEIIWTACPVLILLSIALPSLKALYLLDDPFNPNITIKAMGHQWYWSYEYSDFPSIEFDSYMLPSSDSFYLARLLETDNSVVLPTQTQIRVITSATDVIHSWTVPALGVKADAMPGRLNQLMFSINRAGIFYGQCSEICGANHSFMPIKIEAVPMKSFIKWISSF
uniref:Cytochrome c oxidase subunit 2 n=1 Tax=Parhyale hawaiensis TaxID=317513 RepID=Q6DVJ1_9CRUS|nr:cytochrome c oxidase subunit II [Parhyale hawaiensis]AAT69308.1 cytochrome c oxidase subunit 2 [Parhyale hawaiensis]AYB71603.1 cytochrome oxidase subunit 2 [Parhyale hawaiensis]